VSDYFFFCPNESHVVADGRYEAFAYVISEEMSEKYVSLNSSMPWKLGSLEDGDVDTLSGKRCCSICASWSPTDDENLDMLLVYAIIN